MESEEDELEEFLMSRVGRMPSRRRPVPDPARIGTRRGLGSILEQREELEDATIDDDIDLSEEELQTIVAIADEVLDEGDRTDLLSKAGVDAAASEGAEKDSSGEPKPSFREQQKSLLEGLATDIEKFKPSGISPQLKQALQKQLDRDPTREGELALERVKELSGLETGRRALEAQKARAEDIFRRTTPSRIDNLIATLAAGRGGLGNIAVRGGELREAEAERLRSFDATMREIENKSIDLERTVGVAAANSYENGSKKAETAINNAVSSLQRMESQGNTDAIARFNIAANSTRDMADYLGSLADDERARAGQALQKEDITSLNANRTITSQRQVIDDAYARIEDRRERIASSFQMQLLNADPEKITEISQQINDLVNLDGETAKDLRIIEEATNKLQAAAEVLSAVSDRLGGDSVDFGAGANKLIEEEG